MDAQFAAWNKLIESNREEFGILYNQLQWLSYAQGFEAEEKREALLKQISPYAKFLFHKTKPVVKKLSPGCQRCGEGSWSCLFINGKCNANCFYCPTAQDQIGLPVTNTIEFERPENYIKYLRKFGFTGASLSGGEPLLTFERTLEFVQKIKEAFGDNIYLWLYTNGILLDKNKLDMLRSFGLDEIRIDIGAVGYKLDKIEMAIGKIPHVTVEIPAVPEEADLLKQKVIELDKMGVNYLNLHQLRITPYNYQRFLKRNYTYLHGPKVTVLESELLALDMLSFIHDNQLDIGGNYCSFIYKHRLQKAAARKRMAAEISGGKYESPTENGYLRIIEVKLTNSAAKLLHAFTPGLDYKMLDDAMVAVGFPVLKAIKDVTQHVQLSYVLAKAINETPENIVSEHVQLNYEMVFEITRITKKVFSLSGKEISDYIALVESCSLQNNLNAVYYEIGRMEFIEEGLLPYF